MRIFGMGAVFTLGILAFLGIVIGMLIGGVVLLILAAVLKRFKKLSRILMVIGLIILAFPMFLIGASIVHTIQEKIDYKTKLGINVLNGRYEKAEELLEDGVEVDCTKNSNKKAKDGEFTLLAELVWHGFISYETEEKTYYPNRKDMILELVEMETLLLKNGANPNYRVKLENRYIESPHSSKEAQNGEKTNGHHACGKTPFLMAVAKGDLESTKVLVKYGADINAIDDCGYNAVLVCVSMLERQEGYDMLEYLLSIGCDPTLENNFGQDVFDLIEYNNEQYGDTAWPWKQEEMKELLLPYFE